MTIAEHPAISIEHPRSDSIVNRFDRPAFRRRAYVLLALLFFIVGWLVSAGKAYKKHEYVDFVFSDAEGYYIYLPTLVLDRDLDFGNQLALHATMQDVDAKAFRSTSGNLRNRWPVGVALTLSPAFLLAHGMATALQSVSQNICFAPNGYSLIYQLFCSAGAMAMGCWGMCLADGMIAREFRLRGRSIAAGVLVYWLGTNYAYYFFREPLMAHLISATWVIAAASVCQRIITAARDCEFVAWHWPALSAAMAMAVTCRFTNASLLPLLLLTAMQAVRAGHLIRLLKWLPLILLAITPFLIQVLIWRASSGTAIAGNLQQIGYQSQECFFWTDPALLSTLISSRHGLLFWSPVLIVSLAGISLHLAQGGWKNIWLSGLIGSGLLLWYLNSAWYAWGFGYSFGARAFLELAGLFITGFALLFEELSAASMLARKIVLSFIALSIIYSYGMMSLYILKVVPRDDFLFPRPGIKPPPGLDSYYRPYIPPKPLTTEAR